MLQGLFFLQGSFGKLINLGKGIHFQDENFECYLFFFYSGQKISFQRKRKYGKNACQLHKELLELILKLGVLTMLSFISF